MSFHGLLDAGVMTKPCTCAPDSHTAKPGSAGKAGEYRAAAARRSRAAYFDSSMPSEEINVMPVGKGIGISVSMLSVFA